MMERVELRNDEDGNLDDVVIRDVYMFRMERMDDDAIWMSCYLDEAVDKYVDFTLRVEDGKLLMIVTDKEL